MSDAARTPLDLAKALAPEVYGKRCAGCRCDFDWIHFRKDASSKDGHAALCWDCEAQPRLNTTEHISRLKESNFNSEGVRRQRWAHQDELRDDEARVGRPMLHSDFLAVVQRLVPNLYIVPGRIEGDLAIYETAPCGQKAWDGQDFRYLFFCPTGLLPEFSQYEFDHVRDIPIRESRRGWRTVLLRLIKMGLMSEEVANKVFGRAEGNAAARYNRQLWQWRNSN